jgi:hypothetical protein
MHCHAPCLSLAPLFPSRRACRCRIRPLRSTQCRPAWIGFASISTFFASHHFAATRPTRQCEPALGPLHVGALLGCTAVPYPCHQEHGLGSVGRGLGCWGLIQPSKAPGQRQFLLSRACREASPPGPPPAGHPRRQQQRATAASPTPAPPQAVGAGCIRCVHAPSNYCRAERSSTLQA